MTKQIVIIGGGLAGTTAARQLSERGQAVTVIDPNAGQTCERPPLSKHLFDDSRYHLLYHLENRDLITFVRDTATEITLAEAGAGGIVGTVHLNSGETLDFTHAVLATGMEANRLEIPAYPDALPVYSFGEAEWVRALVGKASRTLDIGVLGSGYLGMEVAASAVAAGHRATVYLRGEEPLRKQLSAPVRQALFEKHRAAGVDFVTHTAGPDDIPSGVHDLFITSVGARPVTLPIDGDRPAEAWDVDEKLATSHPDIWAAGDCARITAGPAALDRPWACEPVAESHGKHLAEVILAESDNTADPAALNWNDVPWHWSFQGPEKVFTAGLTTPDATDTVIRADPTGVKFQVFHFDGTAQDSTLIGVETLNWPPMQAAARRILGGHSIPTRAQLEDPDFDLKAHSRL